MLHLVVGGQGCVDWKGGSIEEGAFYLPTDDPCYTCTCDHGIPRRCFGPLCAHPGCEVFERIEGSCCEVRCIEAPPGGPLLVRRAVGVSAAAEARKGKA